MKCTREEERVGEREKETEKKNDYVCTEERKRGII